MSTTNDNPIEKWTNHMNRQLMEEEIEWWLNIHLNMEQRKVSISQVIMDIQMKITMNVNSYLTDRQKLKFDNTECGWECGETEILLHCYTVIAEVWNKWIHDSG